MRSNSLSFLNFDVRIELVDVIIGDKQSFLSLKETEIFIIEINKKNKVGLAIHNPPPPPHPFIKVYC